MAILLHTEAKVSVFFLLSVAETYIFLPVFEKKAMTEGKLVNQTRKTYLFILPLVVLIFAPRMINLVLFFAAWRGLESFLTFAGALTIYTIGFVILICTQYKEEWRQNGYPFTQNYLTSFFCPCVIVYPESKLIFYSCVLSTIPHLILTSALLIFAQPQISLAAFDFLFPCLLISNVFSWLLHAYSLEKTKQILMDALSFTLIKFFFTTIVLWALDEITDILTATDYFRYSSLRMRLHKSPFM